MIQNLEELDNTFNESFYYQSQPAKCDDCGKPNINANCHAHERGCKYYCNNNNIPIGNGLFFMLFLTFIYIIIKFTKKINLWKQLKKNKKF